MIRDIFAMTDSVSTEGVCIGFFNDETKYIKTVGSKTIAIKIDNRVRSFVYLNKFPNEPLKYAYIEVNNEKIAVHENCIKSDIFPTHNMSFQEVIEEEWAKSKEKDIEKWKSYKDSYDDIIEWKKELFQMSNGFENTFDDDIGRLVVELHNFRLNIIGKIETEINAKYFNYESSTVKDLSIVDKVDRFVWNRTNSYYIIDYVNDELGMLNMMKESNH